MTPLFIYVAFYPYENLFSLRLATKQLHINKYKYKIYNYTIWKLAVIEKNWASRFAAIAATVIVVVAVVAIAVVVTVVIVVCYDESLSGALNKRRVYERPRWIK